MWLLFFISGSGTVLLGILDRGSIPCAPWARWAIGAPLWMAGMGMAVWAIIVLGYATTFGSEGQIACQGPYRFSRNPQYVGFAAALIGWAILTGSKLTFISALVGTMAFLLAPFAEEPWLEEKYGKKYAEYKRKVPRFLFQKKQKR